MKNLNGVIIHRFAKVETSDQYKEVAHYERTHQTHPSKYIEDFANISVQRHFNRSQNVAFWYKTAHRKGNGTRATWSKQPITGLFRTAHPQIYYGDLSTFNNGRRHRHSLLFFVFNTDRTQLAILEYPNYYPFDIALCVKMQVIEIKRYFGLK